MFESIVLRRSESGVPVSAGQLAEALLYYQNVHLIIDLATFSTLVQQLGIAQLLALLRRPSVSAVHCEETLGTKTQSHGAFQVHDCAAFTFLGHESVGKLKTRSERLGYSLVKAGLSRRAATKFAEIFVERVPVRRLTGDQFIKGGIPAAAKKDLLDPSFTDIAVRCAIATIPGGYEINHDLKFEVIDSDLGLHVFTNIDLQGINRRRQVSSPPLEPLAVAHLLSYILDARADLALASFYGGDFYTFSVTSAILQVHHDQLFRRAGLNSDARRYFSEAVLPDCRSVAEVIDGGERSFDEFLLMLDKAERFKSWLKSVNPDEGLIRTYMRDVSSEGWVQKLPAKTLRYAFTMALDATNPIAGVAAGLVDNFLLEKLLGGWRPNHFINARLGPFVGDGMS